MTPYSGAKRTMLRQLVPDTKVNEIARKATIGARRPRPSRQLKLSKTSTPTPRPSIEPCSRPITQPSPSAACRSRWRSPRKPMQAPCYLYGPWPVAGVNGRLFGLFASGFHGGVSPNRFIGIDAADLPAGQSLMGRTPDDAGSATRIRPTFKSSSRKTWRFRWGIVRGRSLADRKGLGSRRGPR